MYSVVFFKNENTVDAVPSHWVKNGCCAWPKKNIKKSIERKLQPNDIEYDYFPVRVLKKKIDSLQEARAKAKIAEQTSDLDQEIFKKQPRNRAGTSSSTDIPNPPIYIPDENEIDCDHKRVVSENTDDMSRDPSYQLPIRNELFLVSPRSMEKLKNASRSSIDYNFSNQGVRRHLDFENNSYNEECLYPKVTDKANNNTPPSNVTNCNAFIEESHNSLSNIKFHNKNKIESKETASTSAAVYKRSNQIKEHNVPRTTDDVSYIYTVSSPFKVTNYNVSRTPTFEEQSGVSNMNNQFHNRNKIQYEETASTSAAVNKRSNQNDIEETYNTLEHNVPRATDDVSYIYTAASPFKVTNYNVSRTPIFEELQSGVSNMNNQFHNRNKIQYEETASTSAAVNKRSNQNYIEETYNTLEHNVPRTTADDVSYIYTPSSQVTSKVSQPTDLMQKILRAVLKTKDYVEANGERLDKLETFLYNSTSRNEDLLYEKPTENIFRDYFPINNEDSLDEFEQKLNDKVFRSNVINEIKHYSKKELVPTVREIMRQMFHDALLKKYSYVGQKGKKKFSSLASCAVITEAVKKMKTHKDSTNIQIAAPIKTYLSGAPARLIEK